MPHQSDGEIAAIRQAVNEADSLDKLIQVIAEQELLLAQDGTELDKNQMIIRIRQIKNDRWVLQAVVEGQYPWPGSGLTSNYNLRNQIIECAKNAWTKLNAPNDDLPVVNLAAPFRYVPKSQAAVPPNPDFKEFVERLSFAKWQSPGAKLSTLLTNKARENIIDYFLVDSDPSVAAQFNGSQQLKIRREMAAIAALKPGEAYRLDKKATGLPRTLNVLRGDDGQFMLIVETKSKLANNTKQKLPYIGGTTKTGKPAWRIDGGEVEYFNLVAKVRDQQDIIELSQEVDMSKRMAAPEVQQNILGVQYANKGQEKISVYSVKADGSLESLLDKNATVAQSRDQQDALIMELLRGVKIFHDQGYAHQDLKPGNILVYGDAVRGYHLKLTDFGLVRKNGTNEDPLATSGYQSPEISYYHSHPKASQHGYYSGPHAVHTLAHALFVNNPQVYPMDGSGRNAVRTPDSSNDMWAIGVIAFEIRFGRQPGPADWQTIQADPLLQGLFTDKAHRLNINNAMAMLQQQITLRNAPLPAVERPTLRRVNAQRQLAAPPIEKNPQPKFQQPAAPKRPQLQRQSARRQLPIRPLPPPGSPPSSVTPPPPAGSPPPSSAASQPPPGPSRGQLRRASAIRALRQPQDALGDLLAKAPQLQAAGRDFAQLLDAVNYFNSAQGKQNGKTDQAKCLYALLSLIKLPSKKSDSNESMQRFVSDNKAFLEHQFPNAIGPIKGSSNDEMKKAADRIFPQQQASRPPKLGDKK